MKQYKKYLAVIISGITLSLMSLQTQAASIQITQVIPWANAKHIASNIKEECAIQTQLSEFIASYSAKNNIEIERVTELSPNAGGKVLDVKITDAISEGGALRGHRKLTLVTGTLIENGKKLASFEGRRMSGGGFFGGYKGSCSVLGRTVKALGKDIAQWLNNPVDGATIGDL